MEFSSTVVEHRDQVLLKENNIFPPSSNTAPIDPRIIELERTISAADKRVDSIKHRLDYMRREYEAAGRIKSENEQIRVESPEVFLSPRKYETEAYTARSFKIQSSDECFDVAKKNSSQSVDYYTKLRTQNPLEHVDDFVDETTTTISIKSQNARDDNPLGKIGKKRKTSRSVKRSSSKSTTASKYASTLLDVRLPRKVKRRRQRHHPGGTTTHYEKRLQDDDDDDDDDNNKKEIVELFTNSAAAKSDPSLLSIASSQAKFKFTIDKPDIGTVIKKKNLNTNKKKDINSEQQQPAKSLVKNQTRIEIKPDGDNASERKIMKKKNIIDDEKKKEENVVASFQRQTFASNAKRHNRCYYYTRKFNYIQSIPFVVGTSVNRTHNIGLNIQLALSLMKTHQPSIATSIRPIFIKKFQRGFLNNNNFNEFEGNLEHSLNELLRQIDNQETANYNDHDDDDDDELKIKNIDINRIQSVMIELHNHFEKLHLKYEKLQEQVKISKDKPNELEAEMKKLEIELSEKEQEIQQVVALYKEFISRTTSRHYSSKSPSTSTRLTALLRKIQSFQQQLITT